MLRMHFLLALATAAFLLPATAMTQAIAQPIYRCGNTYSQESCKGCKVVEDKTTNLHSGNSGSIAYFCKSHDGMAVRIKEKMRAGQYVFMRTQPCTLFKEFSIITRIFSKPLLTK